MKKGRSKIAVLISGRGSNMQSIVRACDHGDVRGEVVVVVSNRSDAAGLQWADLHGIPTRVVPHRDYPNRESHDRAVVEILKTVEVEWVCLAGYMRLLSPWFVSCYEHRILNIHPSLLPSFPGLHAQKQALEHGVRWSGCTVHLVDAELDHGPIVAQTAVAVKNDDRLEDLEQRILENEHATYVRALASVLENPWALSGRKIVFSDFEQNS